MALALACFWMCGLVLALMPPIADALTYQLVLPDLYRRMGRVAPPPLQLYFHFPQATEMLYLLGLQLGGELMPSLINLTVGLAMVVGTGILAYELWGRQAGFAAALMISSLPLTLKFSLGPYPEYALMVCVAIAAAAFLRWAMSEDPVWLLASGAVAGMGMSVKYTGFGLVVVIGICALLRRGLSAFLTVLGCAVLAFSPWLVKNLIYTGNPVVPFLGRWLGGPPDVIRFGEVMAFSNSYQGVPLKFGQLVALPWFLSTTGLENCAGTEPVGPLYLGLLFLVPFCASSPGWGWLAGLTLGLYGLWLLSVHTTRYLAPCLTLLSVLCSGGLVRWGQRGLYARRFGWWLFWGLIAINGARALVQIDWMTFVSVACGQQSREALLLRKLGGLYGGVDFLNRTAPKDATVMFFGEDRGYHCRLKTLIPTRYAPHPLSLALNRLADADAVRTWLRDRRIAYLLVNERYFPVLSEWEPANALTERGRHNWERLKRRWLRARFQESPFVVWQIQ